MDDSFPRDETSIRLRCLIDVRDVEQTFNCWNEGHDLALCSEQENSRREAQEIRRLATSVEYRHPDRYATPAGLPPSKILQLSLATYTSRTQWW